MNSPSKGVHRRVSRSQLIVGLVFAAIIIGMPFGAHYLRKGSGERCDYNGMRIEPEYRVRIAASEGSSYTFCCIRCASDWLSKNSSEGHQVFVTDEASGKEIEASKATFVRSSVVTNPVTRNRIHVFAAVSSAEKHARRAHGTLLKGSRRPFLHLESEQVNHKDY